MEQIEFAELKEEVAGSKKEIESLKNKTLCLTVTLIAFMIFSTFSVVSMSRQYSIIHDYYMDSQKLHQDLNQSLDELLPKIESILLEIQ